MAEGLRVTKVQPVIEMTGQGVRVTKVQPVIEMTGQGLRVTKVVAIIEYAPEVVAMGRTYGPAVQMM